VAANQMRIVLLRDTPNREHHAVLAARAGPYSTIAAPAFAVNQDLPHDMPLFGLKQDGVTLFAAPYAWNLRGSIVDFLPATSDALSEEPMELRGSIAASPEPAAELPPVQPLL
jgi:hypothetical protein